LAESHLPPFGPCITYSALLDRRAIASSEYFEALSELLFLAGKQNSARFGEAKRNCEICLRNCERTVAAMRAHKAAHGC
jgi:hypothetical protein